MPVVKWKDKDGELIIKSGERSVELAVEMIFEEACGMTLTQLAKAVCDKVVLIDNRSTFFSTFVKPTLVKSAQAKADIQNVAARLKNRARKYGFKACPECGTVHTTHVLWCHKPECGHDIRDTVPQEEDDEIREYVQRPAPILEDAEDIEKHKDEEPEQESSLMDDLVLEDTNDAETSEETEVQAE
jgi:hypothetical protein